MPDEIATVADAIMTVRRTWRHRFGRQPKVMAIDIAMAEAAVKAMRSQAAQTASKS